MANILSSPGLRPGTLLKKRLWHRCFPVKFVISKNPIITEHLLVTPSLCHCWIHIKVAVKLILAMWCIDLLAYFVWLLIIGCEETINNWVTHCFICSKPIFNQCSASIPPENIRKPEVFWCFQGVQKWYIGWKWVNHDRWRRENCHYYRVVALAFYFMVTPNRWKRANWCGLVVLLTYCVWWLPAIGTKLQFLIITESW